MKVSIGKYTNNEEWVYGRRIDVVIEKHDIWNLDNTLAHIIVPAMEYLRDDRTGHGTIADEDVPDNLKTKDVESPSDEFYSLEEKKWDWVLNEIIWAFSEIREGKPGLDEILEKHAKKKKYGQFGEIDIYTERVNRGTLLFGKYYSTFWT
jgi:hypothetical protein